MVFGERLKALRTQMGHSQKSLADILGVTSQQVYRWEVGENRPTAENVADVARKLGTTTDYLLGLTETTAQQSIDYTPLEHRLILAFRNGDLVEAFVVAAELAKRS